MRFQRAVVAMMLTVAVAGCATSYHSKGFTGGFSETVLAPDTFRIRFAGNGFTDAERASDFALLRAAEKSLELGCRYFGIMDEADGASVQSLTLTSVGWNRRGGWGFSNTLPIVKPNTRLLVKCSPIQPVGGDVFDAAFVVQSIRAKYGFKTRARPAVAGVAGPVSATTTTEPTLADTGPGPSPLRPAFPRSPLAEVHHALAPMPVSVPVPAAAAVASRSSLESAVRLSAYTQMVAAAQQVASQIGCGTVSLSGMASFRAACESYDVQIDCDGNQCRPMHTLPKP